MKTVKTQKGTELPLTNLKGKDYLMVAYRLQWLTEDVPNYDISTELLSVTDDQTLAKATITLYDKEGKVIRKAQATKRETKKDFSDHTEKAETAAIGRALAMLGFGTQHALADLDEGQRIVDSPLSQVTTQTTKSSLATTTSTVTKPKSSFKSTTTVSTQTTTPASTSKADELNWS